MAAHASLDPQDITVDQLPALLENDISVKVAGVDVDGVLRGKLMAKKKFLGIAKEGFGFCSVIFGWDMHDMTYVRELKISNKENGYRDIIAVPDLKSFRRIPWEDNIPFFLVSFFDPDTGDSLSACPRSLLQRTVDKLAKQGMGAMAGGRYSQYALGFESKDLKLMLRFHPATSLLTCCSGV
jgi:glutamine synthetase